MKTHAVLFDNSKYKCNIDVIKSIYMTVDYIISPYRDLGRFSFNNFANVPLPIIGLKCSKNLLEEILQWSSIRRKIIRQYQECQYTIDNEFDRIQSIQIYKLLCGEYSYEMQFYNDISKDSTLTKSCYKNIVNNPENYILAFTNLYK